MLLRLILYLTNSSMLLENAFQLPYFVLFSGIAANIFYLFLISGTGYFWGMLVEINKLFAFIVPAFFLGLARAQNELFVTLIRFLTQENSLLIFSGKVLTVTILMFASSMMIYNRVEVKR
ncbi:MAG: hypothetical protein GX434_03465 [Peptococcaceae bacterium]|nr:hypothetical protein [Peptococcaceae bacterium]